VLAVRRGPAAVTYRPRPAPDNAHGTTAPLRNARDWMPTLSSPFSLSSPDDRGRHPSRPRSQASTSAAFSSGGKTG
jgi:hypothetical protein